MSYHPLPQVLAEVLDHCPITWLDALHAPVMRLATYVGPIADAARRDEAEALVKVGCKFEHMLGP